MSTIYKIEMNVVSDWVKLSEKDVEKSLKNMMGSMKNYVLRISEIIKVKEIKK